MPAGGAAALTAACGGSNAPKAESQSGGFTSYSSSEGDFSISVPSDWEAFSNDALSGEAVSDFVEENPQFAGMEDQRYAFLAGDPDSGSTAASANVIVQKVPAEARIEDAVSGVVREVKTISSSPETFRHELVSLPAGRALLLAYSANAKADGVTRSMGIRQYFVIASGRLFVITYAAGLGEIEAYEGDFERSAESFEPKP